MAYFVFPELMMKIPLSEALGSTHLLMITMVLLAMTLKYTWGKLVARNG